MSTKTTLVRSIAETPVAGPSFSAQNIASQESAPAIPESAMKRSGFPCGSEAKLNFPSPSDTATRNVAIITARTVVATVVSTP